MASIISALEAKFILLNYQKCDPKFLQKIVKKCYKISDYRIKQYDDLTSIETISLIKKEKSAIEFYSSLIFCIFADCERDGFISHDRAVIFGELLQACDPCTCTNHIKRPILFLINDCKSTQAQYSCLTKISNIYISVNTYKVEELFEHSQKSLNSRSFFNQIGQVITSHKKVSLNSTENKRVQIEPKHDFLDISNVKIEKFAKILHQISSNQTVQKGNFPFIMPTKTKTPIKPSKHGKCLIFKYDFDQLSRNHENMKMEQEAESNAHILTETLKLIDIEKKLYENLTYKEMFVKIKAEASRDIDLLIVCLLTYCDKEHFYSLDKKVRFKKLTTLLNEQFSISTPKMLFILNCGRGKYEDLKPTDFFMQDRIKLPENIILFYADCPKTAENILYIRKESQQYFPTLLQIHKRLKTNSWTSDLERSETKQNGSLFIQSLFKVVEDYGENFDFVTITRITMLKNIFSLLSEYSSSQAQNVIFKSTLKAPIILDDYKDESKAHRLIVYGNINLNIPRLGVFDISNESYSISRGVCFLLNARPRSLVLSEKYEESHLFSKLKNTLQDLRFEKIIEIQHKTIHSNLPINFSSELLLEMAINAENYDCFALILLTNGKPFLNEVKKFIQFPIVPRKPKLIFIFDTAYDSKIDVKAKNQRVPSNSSESSNTCLSDDEEVERFNNPFNKHFKMFYKSMKFTDYLLFYAGQNNSNSYKLLSKLFKLFARTPTDDIVTILSLNISSLFGENSRQAFFLHSSLTKLVKFNQDLLPISSSKNILSTDTSESEADSINSISSIGSVKSIKSIEALNKDITRKKCAIFENLRYSSDRKGTDYKCDMLANSFEELNISVKKHRNLSYSQLLNELDEISKADYSNCEYFLLCILAHGNDDQSLYCDDGHYINKEDLINSLANNKTLYKKPKILIIETCRGQQQADDMGNEILDEIPITSKISFNDSFFIHLDLGILYCIRPCHNGSYNGRFVSAFCEIVKSHHKTKDLASIATMVSGTVAEYGYQVHFSSSLRKPVML